MGLEALSRGAGHVTFVDQSRNMCGLIEANLQALGVEQNCVEVASLSALDFLRRSPRRVDPGFDVIFFDPPYATDYEVVIDGMGEQSSRILSADGVVIVEHHKKKLLPEELKGLKRYRELKQGDSVLSFYQAR